MKMTNEEREFLRRKWEETSDKFSPGSKPFIERYWLMEFRREKSMLANGHLIEPIKRPSPTLSVSLDKSVIAEVREAMRAFPNGQAEAAQLLGIGDHPYRIIMKLIRLKDEGKGSPEDQEKIASCLDFIESTRRIRPIQKAANDIIARLWVKENKGRPRPKKESKSVINHRRRRFDTTVSAICESCESTVDMELPSDFSKEDAVKAIGSLARSVELISKLLRNLAGDKEEK